MLPAKIRPERSLQEVLMHMSDSCSVATHLEITPAGIDDYNKLSAFHYRQNRLGPYQAIYAMKDKHPLRSRPEQTIGVIVYTMPAPNLELRNIATGDFFKNMPDRAGLLQLINENIRCIGRVIIEPRYRSLGLASKLVSETMPLLKAPIIEAAAVMGTINPFFEKAGMTAYYGKTQERIVRMTEAFGMVGIGQHELIDPQTVQAKMDNLSGREKEFIDRQINVFLAAYGKRRFMQQGIERTRFVLSRLGTRPAYYIWLNPAMRVKGLKLLPQQMEDRDRNGRQAHTAD